MMGGAKVGFLSPSGIFVLNDEFVQRNDARCHWSGHATILAQRLRDVVYFE